jgi:hypothetical protein
LGRHADDGAGAHGVMTMMLRCHDAERFALDGVEETNNIRVGRIKLVPRTERLKSQEQEVPENDLLSVRTDENVPSSSKKKTSKQLLFVSILKKAPDEKNKSRMTE